MNSMKLEDLIKSYVKGQRFHGAELLQIAGSSEEDVRNVIRDSLCKELIVPVYRLNTKQKVKELENNDWTEDLPKFAKIFTLEDETIFDGRNPKNIEIAFLRV
jgi:hypothetical protein